MSDKPACPNCGSKKSEQARRGRRCTRCGVQFDPTYDGPLFSDPVKNAEALERAARAERRPRRMR